MKRYALLCVSYLFAWVASAQEFKFYLNGSTVDDSIYVESFQKGDLMRVVFSGRSTPYKFRIATVLVTLIPRAGNELITSPTSFVLDNSSTEYSSYPTYTFDLLDQVSLLKRNDYDVSIKVNQLFADTDEGTGWVEDHVKFRSVTIKKRDKVMASNKQQ
ncbi:hypothetical protein [Flavisolibacter tropicus]|uniref:Uncharacterized protein n=1 Tax=Flavisolibacter tropicus TaxID=1492898 RepID=A0A172TW57_9BACT|nr:hypothetical protein [Flavisolibacter tropicus]ANE51260.1 hypothetical protein SY85_12815 [Flavisolibacter tropicus]